MGAYIFSQVGLTYIRMEMSLTGILISLKILLELSMHSKISVGKLRVVFSITFQIFSKNCSDEQKLVMSFWWYRHEWVKATSTLRVWVE